MDILGIFSCHVQHIVWHGKYFMIWRLHAKCKQLAFEQKSRCTWRITDFQKPCCNCVIHEEMVCLEQQSRDRNQSSKKAGQSLRVGTDRKEEKSSNHWEKCWGLVQFSTEFRYTFCSNPVESCQRFRAFSWSALHLDSHLQVQSHKGSNHNCGLPNGGWGPRACYPWQCFN